jgi:hypothetical protein
MAQATLLRRIRLGGLVAGAGLALSLAMVASAEEPANGGLVTSTASPAPTAPGTITPGTTPPAPVPAKRLEGEGAATAGTMGAPDEMPPAALAPQPTDPVLERMRAEEDLMAAHTRLQEADRAVSKMLRRNYPRGDARAEMLAEQTAAERSFHEAQSAVDHLDSRDGW